MNAAARRFDLASRETAWPTLTLCAAMLAAQGAAAWAGMSGRLPEALAVLICGAAAYAQFTVAHDASHGSLSRRDWLNTLGGYVAGVTLLMPYEAFRRNHLHHHAHTNDPEQDPDFWVAGSTLPRTILRCATILQYHYYSYLFRLRRKDAVYARSMTFLAAMFLLILTGTATGHAKLVILYWLIPAQLGTALLGLLFDYWPHRPHTERGRLKDTAIIAPAYLDAIFLRQNIHLIHHLWPTIPWYRYRRTYQAVEPQLREEADGLIWDFRKAVSMLGAR